MPVLAGYDLETELRNSPERRVWIARRIHDNIRVVLKIIPLCEQIRVECERRGARIQADVSARDARVPKIIDATEYNGELLIAVDYIPGKDLYERIRRGDKLSETEAVAMLRDLLESMIRWGSNVIHGDITPGNILLRTGGGIAILDFGIAKNTTGMTHNPMRTLPYCDPERAKTNRVSRASDLWSASVVCYHANAGRTPFSALNGQITFGTVARIPGCSAGLTAIFEKALALDPKHRYATPEQYLRDLDKLAKGEPTEAEIEQQQQQTRIVRPRATRKLPRWAKPAAAAILTAAGAGYGYTRIPADEKDRIEFGWQGWDSVPLPGIVRDHLRKGTRAIFEKAIVNYRGEVPLTKPAEWHRLLTLRERLDKDNPRDAAMVKIVEGHSLRLRRDYEQARRHFAKAAALDPASPDPYIALSRIHAYNLIDPEKVEAAQRESSARGHQHTRREAAELADSLRVKSAKAPSPKALDMLERAANNYRVLADFGDSRKHLAYCERRITWLRQRLSESEPRR